MAIVVDASLLVRLASGGGWATEIDAKIVAWATSGEELHAPDLLLYDVESGLRRMVFDGLLTEARAISRLDDVAAIAITLHPHPRGGRLLRMAERQRQGANGAPHYLRHFPARAEAERVTRLVVRQIQTIYRRSRVDGEFWGRLRESKSVWEWRAYARNGDVHLNTIYRAPIR